MTNERQYFFLVRFLFLFLHFVLSCREPEELLSLNSIPFSGYNSTQLVLLFSPEYKERAVTKLSLFLSLPDD